jgi:hypothetical protein
MRTIVRGGSGTVPGRSGGGIARVESTWVGGRRVLAVLTRLYQIADSQMDGDVRAKRRSGKVIGERMTRG